jgi:cyclopropane fatty-acyl-phospholipid synthase-like methyltransferase
MVHPQVSPEWYREWFDSSYYHKLYFERNEAEATAFIQRLLGFLRPPYGARMLDLACGRGRHARILASEGFDVTGIDLSENSINHALRYENDHLHFYVHDMREIFYTNYFDYVFNFFTSFGYFRTEREHASALRTVSTSLRANSFFVLDYLNTKYAEDRLERHSQKIIDGVIYHLTKWSDQGHFYKNIRIEDKGLKTPLEFTEKVAKFSVNDFSRMLMAQGLMIQHVFGDYQLQPYDSKNSPRLLVIAQKK